SAAAEWTPRAYTGANTLELRTIAPGEAAHWFSVWVVVIDDQVYVRLGPRAAGRIEKNVAAPYVGVRILGQQFERVRAEPAPEHAAGAVEASALAAGRAQLQEAAAVVEHVDRIAREVPALHQRGARAPRDQRPRRLAHLPNGRDRAPGQDLCLAQVRRDERREGQEPLAERGDPRGLEQRVAAGRHHHRVDDQVRHRPRAETVNDGVDHRSAVEHAGLRRA